MFEEANLLLMKPVCVGFIRDGIMFAIMPLFLKGHLKGKLGDLGSVRVSALFCYQFNVCLVS